MGRTNQQFSLLMALNRPKPPPMGPMDRTTLTAALKSLEVEASPQDLRTRLLVLTKDGKQALVGARPNWIEHHAFIEGRLETSSSDALRGV